MAVRAIRGATQLSADDRDEMIEAVVELVEQMLSANGLTTDALISMILTSTPDLTSEFPAFAARQLGMGDVPLLCASEIDVAGALPRVIRVMAHVDTDTARPDIQHIYLRGAEALRRDLAQ
ncbi:MAG TPA: chorismate mutase [Actinobacteria bacterium]|nr:chorismate mutase [Actinomycetota bacterium]HCK78454.1 chorismate mutase [Actinomycetota bacterium]